ncbi:MAG TPA: OFA family MFS transporter [Candidatus Acidoferrales bacterium]|nr:OFA family MFS transporter [Candidatus Acidoferrales bacterium]
MSGSIVANAPAEKPGSGILGEQNRWLYVIIGFLISIVLGLLYAWSIFVLPLEKQFGWTRAQTSLAFTFSIVFFVVGMITGGKHLDKKGPRIVLSIGSIVLAMGLFIASFTQSLPMLYVSYGVFCGFGIGYANVCPIGTVLRWFPDRRGLVSGILVMGFGLAAFVLGSWANYVIQGMGWEWAFRLFGVLSVAFCVGGAQLMKYPAPGWVPATFTQNAGAGKKTKVSACDYTWKQMIQTSTWWIWWTFHLVMLTGGLMVIGHIVPFAVEGGVSNAQAVFAMGVFSVFNGLGRLEIGYLWDKIGRNATMMINAVTMLLGLVCLNYIVPVVGYGALLVAVTLIGASFGGAIPVASSLISASFGSKNFGLNYGLATTPMVFAATVGPYLAGYIRTATKSYESAILTAAFLAAIGIVTGLIVRDPSSLKAKDK